MPVNPPGPPQPQPLGQPPSMPRPGQPANRWNQLLEGYAAAYGRDPKAVSNWLGGAPPPTARPGPMDRDRPPRQQIDRPTLTKPPAPPMPPGKRETPGAYAVKDDTAPGGYRRPFEQTKQERMQTIGGPESQQRYDFLMKKYRNRGAAGLGTGARANLQRLHGLYGDGSPLDLGGDGGTQTPPITPQPTGLIDPQVQQQIQNSGKPTLSAPPTTLPPAPGAGPGPRPIGPPSSSPAPTTQPTDVGAPATMQDYIANQGSMTRAERYLAAQRLQRTGAARTGDLSRPMAPRSADQGGQQFTRGWPENQPPPTIPPMPTQPGGTGPLPAPGTGGAPPPGQAPPMPEPAPPIAEPIQPPPGYTVDGDGFLRGPDGQRVLGPDGMPMRPPTNTIGNPLGSEPFAPVTPIAAPPMPIAFPPLKPGLARL